MMQRIKYMLLICVALYGCQDIDEPVNNVPTVRTSVAEYVGVTTACIEGECWGTNYEGRAGFRISEDADLFIAWYERADKSDYRTYSTQIEGLNEGTTYYYQFVLSNGGIDIAGDIKSFTTKKVGKAIDLGLSVKWANYNIGADSPEDYGDYFAWGEISAKSGYSDYNCVTFDKYFYDIAGDPNYDVACSEWGENWRLPTYNECKELINKCTWIQTSQDGHNGYKVVGPNGNSIFLPASGAYFGYSRYYVGEYGYYWSSKPYLNNGDNESALLIGFLDETPKMYWGSRSDGQSVRPVCE